MPKPVRLTRREVVAAGAVGAASLATVPNAWAARLLDRTPRVGPGQFLDSVATGEPSASAITFWSRLETDRPRSGARLIVARDEGLTRVVSNTVVPTGRGLNGTLKARIGGLDAREEYFFAFESGTDVSPVGRTRTAPAAGSREPLKIGFSSCQNYARGFFNAHADALTQDLDLKLFLGDYVYENPDSGGPPQRADRIAMSDLAADRAKYRFYRADPDLRELHRQVPMMHVWDDHEVADNYNEGGSKRASEQQRVFAYRTAFEWLPRMTEPTERHRIYRKLSYGGLADVFLLDERQYREGDDADGRPRRLLGEGQMQWLIKGLRESTATWKIVAQQVVVARIPFGGVLINDDAWDGYVDDRTRLLSAIRDSGGGIDNVVFLTGDVHVFMANQLPVTFNNGSYNRNQSVATEYVGGAVTNVGIAQPELAVRAIAPWNEQYDGVNKGYGILSLDPNKLDTEFRGAPGYPDRRTPLVTLQRFTQPEGANQLTRLTPASTGG